MNGWTIGCVDVVVHPKSLGPAEYSYSSKFTASNSLSCSASNSPSSVMHFLSVVQESYSMEREGYRST